MINTHFIVLSRLLGAALATLVGIQTTACSEKGDAQVSAELFAAAEQGDIPSLDTLLDGRNRLVNGRDQCQWTPLMKAALNGHVHAARRLLDFGAEVDAADKGGYTAMMLAASNNHAEVVELLVQKGADIDTQEVTNGWTALIWAAKRGHLETVRLLLEYGADRNARDAKGRTAAAWAEVEHHSDVALFLLDG